MDIYYTQTITSVLTIDDAELAAVFADDPTKNAEAVAAERLGLIASNGLRVEGHGVVKGAPVNTHSGGVFGGPKPKPASLAAVVRRWRSGELKRQAVRDE